MDSVVSNARFGTSPVFVAMQTFVDNYVTRRYRRNGRSVQSRREKVRMDQCTMAH
jgi:hypothetical protein